MPAILVVGWWFLFQYLAAFKSLEYAGTSLGGTAYWDHVGGFLAGIAIIWAMVYYLRWQEANQQSEEEEDRAAGLEHQEIAAVNDPFHNFLPK